MRVDATARLVEFDATVPINAAKKTFLEVIACTPDTREHETLVVTRVRPSHVHASLLLIALTNGRPGSWAWADGTLSSTPPTGDRVSVSFAFERDGREVEEPAGTWVVDERSGRALSDTSEGGGMIFAGSRLVARGVGESYDADGTGVLIGLCAFGSEVVACPIVHSPESSVEEPSFIARSGVVPPAGTNVVVRLRAIAPRDTR